LKVAKQEFLPALPGEVTRTSWAPPSNLQYEDWERVGEYLQATERSTMWWLGDWWAFGEHKYGELATQATDEYSYQTLRNAGWVARQIEMSRRRDKLSFSHHAEVAALERKDQDSLLDKAEAEGWNRNELRRAVRESKIRLVEPPPLPQGTYSLIYADPPWRYEHSMTDARRIENQYPTMELEDICSMQVPAAEDCVLFLWATSPKLAESMQVIERWGFTYRTCAVWDKEVIGMGYYFRQQHELLLVATKGTPGAPEESVRTSSVIRSKREQHSKKPELVYELIETMYPKLKKIELFCRESRNGWAGWGNQANAA
jgi:N6-adenosine-specific RNA methylase IME4